MNFDSLKHYVVYIRYKRSGSALLVNLLDAHPNVIFVRNEEMFAKYKRWDRERIFDHLYNQTKRYRNKPFSANGYKYPIEGVGEVDYPLVIGHKSSTRNFPYSIEDIHKFGEHVNLNLKYVHLVRNPYNMISARWQQKEFRRKNAPLDPIIDHLEEVVDKHYRIWLELNQDEYHQLSLESLIDTPRRTMVDLCEFLEVVPWPHYVERCENLIFEKDDVRPAPWTDKDKDRIKRLVDKYWMFFEKYA